MGLQPLRNSIGDASIESSVPFSSTRLLASSSINIMAIDGTTNDSGLSKAFELRSLFGRRAVCSELRYP
jgi:hypothetical protein